MRNTKKLYIETSKKGDLNHIWLKIRKIKWIIHIKSDLFEQPGYAFSIYMVFNSKIFLYSLFNFKLCIE